MPAWYRLSADGARLSLQLHVQPGARSTGVAGVHGDALKLRIAAPAADNKANQLLIDFLHQAFKLPRTNLVLRRGLTSRRKLVEVEAPGPQALACLRNWDQGEA